MKPKNRKVVRLVLFMILGAIFVTCVTIYQSSKEDEQEYIYTPSGYPTLKKLSNGTVVPVYES